MKQDLALKYLLITLLALGIIGCGSTRKLLDVETSAEFTFITSKDLNPDQDGRASPIVIKAFSLSDDRQFKREDFLSLYENPAERLGSDMIDSLELKEFSPDETRIEDLPLTPQTRFIGLMGEFIQYDRAKALLILPIEPHKTNNYTIRVDRLRIITSDE
jgi:type VI secretion system protein VasD